VRWQRVGGHGQLSPVQHLLAAAEGGAVVSSSPALHCVEERGLQKMNSGITKTHRGICNHVFVANCKAQCLVEALDPVGPTKAGFKQWQN